MGSTSAHVKLGVVKTLFDRVNNIPLWGATDESWHQESITVTVGDLRYTQSVQKYSVNITEQLTWWVVGVQADFGLRLGIREDTEQGAVFESTGI